MPLLLPLLMLRLLRLRLMLLPLLPLLPPLPYQKKNKNPLITHLNRKKLSPK
jgi:hypothetical protein